MKTVVKILKIIGIILAVIVAAVGILFGYLTVVEYKPAPEEEVAFDSGSDTLSEGSSISILTFNIGYAALDRDEDFFMDGGKGVLQDNADAIRDNLSGIAAIINEQNADINLLQEVDTDSKRSFGINEHAYLMAKCGYSSALAYNYKVQFVPYPIPPLGKINSGVATMTDLNISGASRIALPCPFKWPVRIGNLKRCMLETRIPIEGTRSELVILNFHLEAYDDGEGKIAQTKQLVSKIEEEYYAGNYVIAGGDFNQSFEGINQPEIKYPDDWMPGFLLKEDLPEHLKFAVSDNHGTCRSLARAYVDPETSQEYIIDGFIVSDNVKVNKVEVIDEGFEYSDHNPVRLEVTLK